MLSESIVSQKELFHRAKRLSVNAEGKYTKESTTDRCRDMVQTSLSFEKHILFFMGNSWTLQQLLPVSRDWKQS